MFSNANRFYVHTMFLCSGLFTSSPSNIYLPKHHQPLPQVDLIPAISDPQGGHWILDSVSGKVIHNNPKALAEFMDRQLGEGSWWCLLGVKLPWDSKEALENG
jgi:hypothetical protein